MTRKLNMTVCWANCPLLNKIKWEKKEEIMMKKNNTQTEIHRNFLLTIHWHVKSSQCMFNHIQKPPHFYNLPQFVWKYLIHISLSQMAHHTAIQNKKYDFCLRMMIVIMTSCYCIHRHTTVLRTIYYSI